VTALTNQASGAGTAMAWANCLMMISEETSRLEAGATVSVLPYVDI
jgi:molybdopterin biosynthesis enzyme